MKFLKILALSLFVLSFNANAASIMFDSGNFQFSANVLIDNDTVGEDNRGIGTITNITQNALTVWSAGDNGEFLNFVFDDFAGTNIGVNSLDPNATDFTTTGGFVDFYLTTMVALYDPTLTFASAVTLLSMGDLFLATVAEGSVNGSFSATEFRANGFLNVVGGSNAERFDTDSVLARNGAFADLTFNISGSLAAVSGQTSTINDVYDFGGSGDLSGLTQDVPEPAPVLLLGLVLLGLGFYARYVPAKDYAKLV